MKKFIPVFACMALFALPVAPAPAGDAVVVECTSLDAVLQAVDTFAQALGAPSPREDMEESLQDMLEQGGLADLDRTRPMRIHVAAGGAAGGSEAVMAVALPLQGNGEAVLAKFDEVYGGHTNQGGRLVFSFEEPMPGQPPTLHVIVKDRYVIAGNGAAVVEGAAAAAAGQSRALRAARSQKGFLRVGVDSEAAVPLLRVAIARTTAMFESMQRDFGSSGMGDPAAILEAEGKLLLAVMEMLSDVSMGFEVSESALDIHWGSTPKPAGALAAALGKLPPLSRKYLGSMPAGSLFAAAGRDMSLFDVMIDPYVEFMDAVYDKMPGAQAGMADKMRRLLGSAKGLYTGAYSIGAGPDGMVQIVGVTDKDRALRLMEEGVAIWASATNAGSPVSISPPRKRTHAGMEIRGYTYRMDPALFGSPRMRDELPPVFSLLTNMTWEAAVDGDRMLYVMGPPTAMNAAVDRMRAADEGVPLTEWPAFKKLIPTPPEQLLHVYYADIAGLVRLGMKFAGADEEDAAAFQTGGGMGGYAAWTGGAVRGLLRFSMGEIASLQKGVLTAVSRKQSELLRESTEELEQDIEEETPEEEQVEM